ncbi:MAG: hypothetical protein VX730_00660 [Pseudomonadota bacterium]|nr:hypothetical protein [Pseudomonadota bacterium]
MAQNLQQIYEQNESAKRRLRHRLDSEKKGMAQIKSAVVLLMCVGVMFFVLTSGFKAQTIMFVTVGMLVLVLVLILGDVVWRLLRNAVVYDDRAEHMISQDQGSPDGEDANYDVVVENWTWKFMDGFAIVVGKLRNYSDKDMPYLMANVRFIDGEKKKLSDTSVLINKIRLAPNEEATFQIIAPKVEGMDQAMLYFTLFENDQFIKSKSHKTAADVLQKRKAAQDEANKRAQAEVDAIRKSKGLRPMDPPKFEQKEPKKKVNPFMNK